MRRNKFNAVRSGGFDSKLEAVTYNILLLRERAGEIKDIRRQDCVELTRAKIRTKIDFSFTNVETGKKVYCESKGVATERWRMIKKLWPYYMKEDLEIWCGDFRKPFLKEIIRSKA